MKKFTIFLTLLLCATALLAQSPEKFSYQAVVRNASNVLVSNAPVGVRVSILQGNTTGNPVYVETQTVNTNANGLLTLEIGGGSVQQGTFAGIDWANGPYFLKTETDPNGGSNYSVTSTQQLLSVPYALYAKEAGNAFSGDYNDLTNTPTIPSVPTNVSAFTNDAGYITGYTETDPTVPAWAKEVTKPAYDYSEIANTPVIPTVPANVSAFTNDAGYLTSYTETDPTVPAWAKEATKPAYDYSEIANTPVIPTVPTNVSAFENDAQYITADAIPTQVSAFNNDAQYITAEASPTNVSTFANDVPYLTEAEYQQGMNTVNGTIDDMNNVIDSLTSRIEELEGYHTPPTVMTTGVSDVAHTTAILNGSVVYIGGAPVSARGFCYDTVMHPTMESASVSCGSGSGSFTANLLNLKSSTTYFVRAFATNMWGTNYGEEKTFTTLTEYAPSVEILPASDISFTSFVCSGDVTDSGTYAVTARGFCWANTPDPVITGEHLHVGSGAGAFSAVLADMQPETTFYVRAYAMNSVGVTYSTPITVSTLTPTIPTVSTDTVNGYNECTGTVLADGNAPVTQRGFCYDTLPNPTLENGIVVAADGGMGEFTATLTGLPIGKLYFVRAFATNAKGTAYGNQMHFLAGCDTKTLTDYDGNVYNTVTIGTQCWMKENLKTTHYSDGWPLEWRNWGWSNEEPYYYFPNQNIDNVTEYGLLYNWPAVMRNSPATDSLPSGVQGICPPGWHVPSDAEWTAMTNYVTNHPEYHCNGSIGKAIADSIGWQNSNISCSPGNDLFTNNSTGFSARPAGTTESDYRELGKRAWFWSASRDWYFNHPIARALYYTEIDIANTGTWNVNGLMPKQANSVRCLRDY